ncbi:S-layer homology domain-containing protein [Paenibacillus chartarius]|uniref:S-layer homology domain-containing protein n=1 Tax=Paenibacillus chartarius TaxID=747481 RepID=A0ABV6DJE1_9BACL
MTGHWAEADVETLASKLIVHGVTDTNFAPEQPVTRAEFAALIARALGLLPQRTDRFRDVQESDWFSGAVGAAAKANLISGYEDGTFRPDAPVTREQMAAMLARALQLGGHEVQGNAALLERFTDRADISAWADEAVTAALSAGIIQGMTDTSFAAHNQATRAQAVTMLKRTLQSMKFMNP